VVFTNYHTLRDPGLNKVLSPFDVTHSFKANFIYELPVGRGRRLLNNIDGVVHGLLGNWGFNGNIRWQSGSPFNFGNVQLVGMTHKELQQMIKVRKGERSVFYLPDDIINNTARAFAVGYASTTNQPTYTQGDPGGRFIAPAGFGNCIQATTGGCGFANLVLKGPEFFRADLSIVKRVRFTESADLELRGEFLNAFNNPNFQVGNPNNDVNGGPLSGIIGNAYQDVSTTNDPGGRLVQIVVRINF
jgi:hypothetical protein